MKDKALLLPLAINLTVLSCYLPLWATFEYLPAVAWTAAFLAFPIYIVIQIIAFRVMGRRFLVVAPAFVMTALVGWVAYALLNKGYLMIVVLIWMSPIVVVYLAGLSVIGILARVVLEWGPARADGRSQLVE